MSIKSTKQSDNQSLHNELGQLFGPRYLEHQDLRPYTASRTGGVADYFLIANETKEIIEAINLSLKYRVPYRIIGSGTGLLFSDSGFPGLIVLNQAQNVTFISRESQAIVESGADLRRFLYQAAGLDLGGLEQFALVPGTVGGAIVSNARVSDYPFWQYVKEVCLLVIDGSETRTLNLKIDKGTFEELRAQLNEQNSVAPVILTARVQLARLPQEEIMERLMNLKAKQLSQGASGLIGHCFNTTLQERKLEYKRLAAARQHSTRILDPLRDVFLLRNITDSQSIRRFLRDIQSEIEEVTKTPVVRQIDFLGYWPDDEAESI